MNFTTVKKIYSKTVRFLSAKSKENTATGHLIALAYKFFSNAILQAIICTSATLVLGIVIAPSDKNFTVWAIIYVIYMALCAFANKYRESKVKRYAIMENNLEEQGALFSVLGEKLYDNINGGNEKIFERANDHIVKVIYNSICDLYASKDFKVTLFSVRGVQNRRECSMETYLPAAKTPEFLRDVYKENSKKELPFFARLLFDDEKIYNLIDENGVVILKDKNAINQVFINNEHGNNSTKQYIGVVVKIDKAPCMLIQVCTSVENGFINDAYIDDVVSKILMPQVPILKYCYVFEMYKERGVSNYEKGKQSN